MLNLRKIARETETQSPRANRKAQGGHFVQFAWPATAAPVGSARPQQCIRTPHSAMAQRLQYPQRNRFKPMKSSISILAALAILALVSGCVSVKEDDEPTTTRTTVHTPATVSTTTTY
jgi:hypothetical protein